MSHRAAHRILAQELRLDRIAARRPADPSHRERKPRKIFTCPSCRKSFAQEFQIRLHTWLNGCATHV